MRFRAVILLLLVVGWGCAATNSDRRSATTPDRPLPQPQAMQVPDTSAAVPEVLGRFQTGVDSAAALFDFGDIADFVAVRDSLRSSIEAIAREYPSMSSDPEFKQVLKSLADLDAIIGQPGQLRPQLDETDSLALSIEEWPEIDSTQSVIRAVAAGDAVFPRMENDRIDFWLRYFTGPGKERFARTLYRMQLYRPIVEPILDELGLPQELIAVAMIESGFNLKARSRARAVGPWQFIAGTARIYGLRVNWWYDERRDIVASTYAAGNYLRDLYGIWESWPLALAAYNCGEYRVARAVAAHKTTDFWKLRLPKQTERYVPKFLAALYILRDPDRYGFTLPNVEPVKFDEVTVADATDLKLIAKSAGTSVDLLRDLNPALLRWATPPKLEVSVKVPVGTGETCSEALERIPPNERITWRKHRIRRGETLSVIARKYGTTTSALKSLNGIRNAHRIREGRYLIVPIQGAFTEVASSKPDYRDKRREISKKALENYAKRFAPPANHKKVVYVVRDRDTLGEIAETYRTSARKLRAWNNLSYRSYIYPGQKLTIYVPESFNATGTVPKVTTPSEKNYVKRTYTVKKGDTFYSISRKFNVQLVELLAWNGKSSRSTIYPGQQIEVWQKRER